MSEERRVAAVFDLDFTITSVDTYPVFLRSMLLRRPSRWLRAALLPLDLAVCRLGLRDNSWLKERALTTIAGDSAPGWIEKRSQTVVDFTLRKKLRGGAVKELKEHQSAGSLLILATASFDCYAIAIARELGFHVCVCTVAERDSRQFLTGRIAGRNCFGDEKVRLIASVLEGPRAAWHVIAYTDHESDLPLLEWSDAAHVVNPRKRMRQIATERGYAIDQW